MVAVAGEIDHVARSIFGDIRTFNPNSLATMNAALQGFSA
jgi:hypothetical protein